MLRVPVALIALAGCHSYIETIGTLPSNDVAIGFMGFDVVYGTTDVASPIHRLGYDYAISPPVQVIGFGQDADDSTTVLVAPGDAPVAMHLTNGALAPLGTNSVRAGATTIVQDADGIRFTAGGATSVLAPGSTTWVDGPVQLDVAMRALDGHVYGRVVGEATVVRMDAADIAVPVACDDCAGFIGIDAESLLYDLHDDQLRVTRLDGSTVSTIAVPGDAVAVGMSTYGGMMVVGADRYRIYDVSRDALFEVDPSFEVTANARIVASARASYLIDGTSIGVVTADD